MISFDKLFATSFQQLEYMLFSVVGTLEGLINFFVLFFLWAVPRCVPDSAQSSRPGEEAAAGLGPRGVHGLWLSPQGRHPRATQRPGCGARHLQVSLCEDVIVATCSGHWSGRGDCRHALCKSSHVGRTTRASSSSGPWSLHCTSQQLSALNTCSPKLTTSWRILIWCLPAKQENHQHHYSVALQSRQDGLVVWLMSSVAQQRLSACCTAGCWGPAGSRFVLVHKYYNTRIFH